MLGDCLTIVMKNISNQGQHIKAIHQPKHTHHRLVIKTATTKGNGLVGQRQTITHRAFGGLGKLPQGVIGVADVFFGEYLCQMLMQ